MKTSFVVVDEDVTGIIPKIIVSAGLYPIGSLQLYPLTLMIRGKIQTASQFPHIGFQVINPAT